MKILISMTEPFIVRSLLKGHLKWLVGQGHSVTVVCGCGSRRDVDIRAGRYGLCSFH